jgi:hypothetical protein
MIAAFAVTLGFLVISEAAPSASVSEAVILNDLIFQNNVPQAADKKDFYQLLKELQPKIKTINKKYLAIKKPSFNDITKWSKEIKNVINLTVDLCGKGGCFLINISGALKIVVDILINIQETLLSLTSLFNGGLIKLILKFLVVDLVAGILQLISALLKLGDIQVLKKLLKDLLIAAGLLKIGGLFELLGILSILL